MPTPDEIKRITELHDQGYSQGHIAKELGKGKTTIHRWLQGLGLLSGTDAERSGTKKATEAKATYDRKRRLALNDKFLKMIEERLDDEPSNSDLKALATTYGIMVDKREILEPPVPPTIEDDGLLSCFEEKAIEVFEDAQDIPVQMDSSKCQTMADLNLVGSDIPNKDT